MTALLEFVNNGPDMDQLVIICAIFIVFIVPIFGCRSKHVFAALGMLLVGYVFINMDKQRKKKIETVRSYRFAAIVKVDPALAQDIEYQLTVFQATINKLLLRGMSDSMLTDVLTMRNDIMNKLLSVTMQSSRIERSKAFSKLCTSVQSEMDAAINILEVKYDKDIMQHPRAAAPSELNNMTDVFI